jgi:hypothetical protein
MHTIIVMNADTDSVADLVVCILQSYVVMQLKHRSLRGWRVLVLPQIHELSTSVIDGVVVDLVIETCFLLKVSKCRG